MSNLKEQLNQLPESERLKLAQKLIFSLNESSTQFISNEDAIILEAIQAWIRKYLAERESQYAEKMKRGEVETYTLAELKAK